MPARLVISRVLVAALASVTLSSISLQAAPSLERIATYDTGLGASGAEILSIRERDGIAALTNVAGSIDVLDLSDPAEPVLLRRVMTGFGTPNSVAVHPTFDYILAVSGSAGSVGKVAAYRISDGSLLQVEDAGILPDSIAIAPNGEWAVIANEAESTGVGQDGGDGSLSLVDLSGFNGTSPTRFSVTQVALPTQEGVAGFSTGRTDDVARLPVDNSPGMLEPESVAFSGNSRHAYVTLQENSGVVRVDARGRLRFFGLGETRHAADLVNGGGYLPTQDLSAFREPDGIAVTQGGRFFVTADEGDTRNGAGGSGPRGGRTMGVFDGETGAFIADTGTQFDDAAAAEGIYPDTRSNRGGSEPEVLDATEWRGLSLVAVSLERANAIALVDITDPADPVVLDLEPVDAAPEGVKFHRSGGNLYVACANEAAGTVSLLRVNH
jgi:hypothetical protein